MPMPGSDLLSICSMSLTVVVRPRSYGVMMRPDMSSGDRPVILERDADHRDADVGEDVGRRLQRRQRADDQDQDRHDDEGERPLQARRERSRSCNNTLFNARIPTTTRRRNIRRNPCAVRGVEPSFSRPRNVPRRSIACRTIVPKLCYRPVRCARVYRYRSVTSSRHVTVTKSNSCVPDELPAKAPLPKRAAERIRESARDLFYRQGIRAVGVEEIVTRAGVTKPSLYRSFPSKDELVADYLRHMGEEGLARFDATIAANPVRSPRPVAVWLRDFRAKRTRRTIAAAARPMRPWNIPTASILRARLPATSKHNSARGWRRWPRRWVRRSRTARRRADVAVGGRVCVRPIVRRGRPRARRHRSSRRFRSTPISLAERQPLRGGA